MSPLPNIAPFCFKDCFGVFVFYYFAVLQSLPFLSDLLRQPMSPPFHVTVAFQRKMAKSLQNQHFQKMLVK